jgi:hypothetical protein
MNDPHMTPALMNDYLAYAIALDLKEAWGDHLSSALFHRNQHRLTPEHFPNCYRRRALR